MSHFQKNKDSKYEKQQEEQSEAEEEYEEVSISKICMISETFTKWEDFFWVLYELLSTQPII